MEISHEHFILIGQSPVAVDLHEWAGWFETAERRVDVSEVGPYVVSTVFLGLDHNFSGKGPPLLFETMVFIDGESENYQTRCATWLEAEAQHRRAVTEFAAKGDYKIRDVYPEPLSAVE